jgi:acetoin utilization protein AcuB
VKSRPHLIQFLKQSDRRENVHRKSPSVRAYMSRLPIEIDRNETIARAEELMEQYDVRHIPVMSGLHLFGIVSLRDVREARLTEGERCSQIAVADVCTREVLTVSPLIGVTEAAQRMLSRKVASAVVVDGDVLVGIFTTTDALRALCDAYGELE